MVFTASMEIYGTAVADRLDTREGILRRRYFRQHCTHEFGCYTKDISAICSDLSSVFILDNSPGAYRAYPGNTPLLTYNCLQEKEITLIPKVNNSTLKVLLCFLDNAIPIKSFWDDPNDTALLNLLPVLDALRFVTDVRSVLSRNREAHRNW